jgi:hypothetical protein
MFDWQGRHEQKLASIRHIVQKSETLTGEIPGENLTAENT